MAYARQEAPDRIQRRVEIGSTRRGRAVQRVAQAAGFDPARHGGHSLPVGLATSAAAAGECKQTVPHLESGLVAGPSRRKIWPRLSRTFTPARPLTAIKSVCPPVGTVVPAAPWPVARDGNVRIGLIEQARRYQEARFIRCAPSSAAIRTAQRANEPQGGPRRGAARVLL
jgi:hypothetical protein